MTASRRAPWVCFAGGGTGGHLYPGIAVVRALRTLVPDVRVTFFTTDRGIDRDILEPTGVEQVQQPVEPFSRKPWKWPDFLACYFKSMAQARDRFAAEPPTAVLGLGGYASVPPVEAALRLGVPAAIFNPDVIPGRANRRLLKRVNAVFVQWDATLNVTGRPPNMQVTGCPVRPEFLKLTRDEGCRACGLDPARPVLLVTGASQGAMTINEAFVELAEWLSTMPEWQVMHVTGTAGHAMVRDHYAKSLPTAKVIEFTPKLGWAMAAADIVVSRAGASTLAELTALGKPSVLLPYPYDRGVHQKANADVLADGQAAVIVSDSKDAKANAQALKPVLKDLMTSPERRRRMGRAAKGISRADAADAIAASLLRLAGAIE